VNPRRVTFQTVQSNSPAGGGKGAVPNRPEIALAARRRIRGARPHVGTPHGANALQADWRGPAGQGWGNQMPQHREETPRVLIATPPEFSVALKRAAARNALVAQPESPIGRREPRERSPRRNLSEYIKKNQSYTCVVASGCRMM